MLPAVTWPMGLPISFFTALNVGFGGITLNNLVAYNLALFVLGYYIYDSAVVKVTDVVPWQSLAMEGRRWLSLAIARRTYEAGRSGVSGLRCRPDEGPAWMAVPRGGAPSWRPPGRPG